MIALLCSRLNCSTTSDIHVRFRHRLDFRNRLDADGVLVGFFAHAPAAGVPAASPNSKWSRSRTT